MKLLNALKLSLAASCVTSLTAQQTIVIPIAVAGQQTQDTTQNTVTDYQVGTSGNPCTVSAPGHVKFCITQAANGSSNVVSISQNGSAYVPAAMGLPASAVPSTTSALRNLLDSVYAPLGTSATATPTSNLSSGTFTGTQTLTFASATQGAALYYTTTTDGTTPATPTSASTLYTGAITVSASTNYRVIAIASGISSTVLAVNLTINSGNASLYPTSAPLSAVGLGENPNFNGFLPGCPTPSNCSIVYKDISGDPVNTTSDASFKGYSNYATATLGPNFDSSAASLPTYVYDSSSDTGLTYIAASSTVIPTESDDTVVAEKSDMVQEGNGNPNVQWTGDGRDRHINLMDKNPAVHATWETYQLQRLNGLGDWYSGTIFDVLRPYELQGTDGYTSSDAGGWTTQAMAFTYYDLISTNGIQHALRMTVPSTSCGFYANGDHYGLFSAPAVHAACTGGGSYGAYMGEWLRLKASTAVPSSCGPQGTAIVNALKKHGVMILDNGRFGLIQAVYDPRIDQNDVSCISSLTGNDLEVVTVNNAKVVAGELNPETSTAGVSSVYDQTGKNKANSTDGQASTCSADPTCGQGTVISNSPPAPTFTSFTASASTVAAGSALTLSAVTTNSDKTFIDNAYGVIIGNSGSITTYPTQNTCYKAKTRGRKGYAYSSQVCVTVTGQTVATPSILPASGTYTSAQTVTITDATANSSIFYSLTGTASCSSTPYTGSFSVSTAANISAIACENGYINSPTASASINVSIPGATPQVNGYAASSASYADGQTQTATYTFAGGTSAIIATSYINSANPPTSVTCGATAATLVGTALGSSGSGYNVAVYRIASAPSGQQTCTTTFGSSVYGRTDVVEIIGSSGTDGTSTGTTTSYPNVVCGSLTTTQTNDLLLAFGQVEYSTVTASSGYTQIFGVSGFAGASLSVPSPATTAVTLNTNNGSTDVSCVAVALKP